MTEPMRASAAPPALAIDALCVSYRSGNARRLALDTVSLSIERGQAYGLVGESGSGKSTLAMAVACYLSRHARVDSGHIELAGRDLQTLDARALREVRRRDIAFVYQDPARALNPTLSIGRQVTEAFELIGARGRAARDAALDVLDRVRLPAPARVFNAFPHELSGGMQQRVVIAMALAKSPALLVLDEATTGLDSTVEADILARVDALRRESGTALLMITHKLPLVAALCDRVGVLEHGHLVEEGPVARVFDRPEHPYTAALLRCVPTLGRSHKDGPLATLDDAEPTRSELRHSSLGYESNASSRQGLSSMSNSASASDATHGVPRSDTADSSLTKAGLSRSVILEARDITKTWGRGDRMQRALDNVSITLRTGETLGLVGESGSGKTTLARIMAGLVEPDTGQLRLDGSPLATRVLQRKRDQLSALQIVFQNPSSALNRAHRLSTLLGRSVSKLAGLRGAARIARVRDLLDAVRLPQERLQARARELSGGQQQRVAIARAFAGQPRVVICDEPTSALDVSVQATILNLLVELQRRQGVSYLFISHDLAVVRFVADRVAVLYRGQIIESGPADRVLEHPAHPYTEALVRASVVASTRASDSATRTSSTAPVTPLPAHHSESHAVKTSVHNARSAPITHSDRPGGCVYCAVCPASLGERCESERPDDIRIGEAHVVRCHLYGASANGT